MPQHTPTPHDYRHLGGVVGVGVDVCAIAPFAAQLALPGSRFARVFTARERRQAAGAPESLAARWAVKEAVIKALSQALYGRPPLIPPERVNFQDIETVLDGHRRPLVQLHGEFAAAVTAALGEVTLLPSLSHDGDTATAFVVAVSGATPS